MKKIVLLTLVIIILIAFILVITSGQDKPKEEQIEKVEVTGEIINGEDLDQETKKLLLEYMDTYYESMVDLNAKDMTYLFEDPEGESAIMNQLAVEILTEGRAMRSVDLSLTNCSYELNIESVVDSGNEVEVQLTEDSFMSFSFMEGTETKLYGIENTFNITKSEDGYKISDYDKTQDFFVMMSLEYNGGGIAELNSMKAEYIEEIKLQSDGWKEDKKEYEAGIGFEEVATDGEYDGKAAASYSSKWVNERNTEEWSEYDGVNCQNYVSQSMYVGGIPENSQWNTSQTTWTYVPHFQEYIENNTGSGIIGTVDANLYYAEPGDVVHVGRVTAQSHATLVRDVYVKDGEIQDVILNSNTLDMENFPVQAYVYPNVSLIKIHGYNE